MIVLLLLLPGDKTFAGPRAWHLIGGQPIGLPAASTPTECPDSARHCGEGAYFPNPKTESEAFSLGKSEHCHFHNIPMDYKKDRTGKEVLTWTIITALNNSRRSEVLKATGYPEG